MKYLMMSGEGFKQNFSALRYYFSNSAIGKELIGSETLNYGKCHHQRSINEEKCYWKFN